MLSRAQTQIRIGVCHDSAVLNILTYGIYSSLNHPGDPSRDPPKGHDPGFKKTLTYMTNTPLQKKMQYLAGIVPLPYNLFYCGIQAQNLV